MRLRHTCHALVWPPTLLLIICLLPGAATAQDGVRSRKEVQRLGISILSEIKSTLKKEYYDPTFHGIDLDARFKTAEERLKTVETYREIYRTIAQVLIELNDSHTTFVPPTMSKMVDYGFDWLMIGDKCFVTDVTLESDAEVKGLKVGDVISGVENYNPTRENLWLLTYLWYQLDPRERLKVFVQLPGGKEKELLIESKVIKTEDIMRRRLDRDREPYRCQELNAEVTACKLYTFLVETPVMADMMKEVRKRKKLILDLRGNRGGFVATELFLIGYFFDQNVKIGDEKRRSKTEARVAKIHEDKVFTGDLIVLIDSASASASEIFARLVQLEKRGTIVGDVSAGKVTTGMAFPLLALRNEVPFELSVTVADFIMSDGKSLEGVGVTPDKAIGPTAQALALGNDPVLAYAAAMIGAQMTPEEAGKLNFLRFPRRFKK